MGSNLVGELGGVGGHDLSTPVEIESSGVLSVSSGDFSQFIYVAATAVCGVWDIITMAN